MAIAYGRTDAPLDTAVATSRRSPYTATASGETNKRHYLPSNSNARNKQRLNLGAWNVRTTNDSDSSIRPERATAQESYNFLEWWRRRENSGRWFCCLQPASCSRY